MENNTKLSEVMMEMKAQIDYLKHENQKYLDLLEGFGYPEKRPQRERNKIYECAEKLIRVVNEAGIQVNLKDYEGITSQAGVPLIPGMGPDSNINYKPFRNVF